MNETLYVLAETAANPAPVSPWATLLGGVLPVLAGAIIGYVLGILRDASKAKADREARHQEEVLNAATGLLETAGRAKEVAALLADKGRAHAQADEQYPGSTPRMRAERDKAKEDFHAERDRFHEAVEAIQPHALRITILAPSMAILADEIVETASDLRHNSPGERSAHIRASYEESRQEFTAMVRAYLKVKA